MKTLQNGLRFRTKKSASLKHGGGREGEKGSGKEREDEYFGSFEAKESKGFSLQTTPEYKHFQGAKGAISGPGRPSPLYFHWSLRENEKSG